MYGNYTISVYDDAFQCVEEQHFEGVMINYSHRGVAVIDRSGKLLYFISTACCTVIVTEDSIE